MFTMERFYRQNLAWCEAHPNPDLETLRSGPLGEPLTSGELEELTDPARYAMFVEGLRRLAEREAEPPLSPVQGGPQR